MNAVSLQAALEAPVGAGVIGALVTEGDQPPSTPITRAALRIVALDKLADQLAQGDREAEICGIEDEQLDLGCEIVDERPQSIADAVIMLMGATAETRSDSLRANGTAAHEFGDIIVRRVMHFLADVAGIDLADYGGSYWLPLHEEGALIGTVAEAALSFNQIDDAKAEERHDERAAMFQRRVIRARYSKEDHERTRQIVDRAVARWNSIPDDDPRFDAARAMLAREGVTVRSFVAPGARP